MSKFLMNLANVLVLAGGIAAVAVGACWAAKVKVFVDFFGRNNEFLPSLLIAAGGCATVVSIAGFCGTSKQSVCLLVTFVLTSIILLVGDIAAIVLVFLKISWFDKNLKDDTKPKTFQIYFSALVGGLGALQMISIVFAGILVTSIKKARRNQE